MRKRTRGSSQWLKYFFTFSCRAGQSHRMVCDHWVIKCNRKIHYPACLSVSLFWFSIDVTILGSWLNHFSSADIKCCFIINLLLCNFHYDISVWLASSAFLNSLSVEQHTFTSWGGVEGPIIIIIGVLLCEIHLNTRNKNSPAATFNCSNINVFHVNCHWF